MVGRVQEGMSSLEMEAREDDSQTTGGPHDNRRGPGEGP